MLLQRIVQQASRSLRAALQMGEHILQQAHQQADQEELQALQELGVPQQLTLAHAVHGSATFVLLGLAAATGIPATPVELATLQQSIQQTQRLSAPPLCAELLAPTGRA